MYISVPPILSAISSSASSLRLTRSSTAGASEPFWFLPTGADGATSTDGAILDADFVSFEELGIPYKCVMRFWSELSTFGVVFEIN